MKTATEQADALELKLERLIDAASVVLWKLDHNWEVRPGVYKPGVVDRNDIVIRNLKRAWFNVQSHG